MNVATHTSESLGKKVAQGAMVQFFGKFFLRGLKFARTVILAQILFPEDFGLFVLASISIGFVDIFVQSGFQAALVQRDVVDRKHMDGAWTVHIIKGVILGLLLFLSAPLVAAFFENDALTHIIQALSLMHVLDGFVNTGVILFQKEFHT